MNRKRRKLRLAPIIASVFVLTVVIVAIIILAKVFDFNNEQKDILLPPETEHNDEVPTHTPETKDDEVIDTPPVENKDEVEIQFNETAPKPVYTQEELLELFPETVRPLTESAWEDYVDGMYFIGDSTTHGMKYYGVLSEGKETTRVLTPRSGTLAMWNLLSEKVVLPEDDSELTIPEAMERIKPVTLVLTLGVNGVSSCTKEQFVGYYKDLIAEIKEASSLTKIILQSIYPVCSDYQYVNSISMEKINRANAWIAEMAHEEGVYYLNTISALVDETGYLNPDYSNGDGIHISPKGFEVILEYINTHPIEY